MATSRAIVLLVCLLSLVCEGPHPTDAKEIQVDANGDGFPAPPAPAPMHHDQTLLLDVLHPRKRANVTADEMNLWREQCLEFMIDPEKKIDPIIVLYDNNSQPARDLYADEVGVQACFYAMETRLRSLAESNYATKEESSSGELLQDLGPGHERKSKQSLWDREQFVRETTENMFYIMVHHQQIGRFKNWNDGTRMAFAIISEALVALFPRWTAYLLQAAVWLSRDGEMPSRALDLLAARIDETVPPEGASPEFTAWVSERLQGSKILPHAMAMSVETRDHFFIEWLALRRLYGNLLAWKKKFPMALSVARRSLQLAPDDITAYFLVQRARRELGINKPFPEEERPRSILEFVIEHAPVTNEYEGFVPPGPGWTPLEISGRLPSREELFVFEARGEPLVVRAAGKPLKDLYPGAVEPDAWNNASRILEGVDPMLRVDIEHFQDVDMDLQGIEKAIPLGPDDTENWQAAMEARMNSEEEKARRRGYFTFGKNPDILHAKARFSTFVKRAYGLPLAEETDPGLKVPEIDLLPPDHVREYLNVQFDDFSPSPDLLNHLRDYIPFPPCLRSVWNNENETVKPMSANLWIGRSMKPDKCRASPHTAEDLSDDGISMDRVSFSGLHSDFGSNFLLMLRGVKRVYLFPPSEAHRMNTVMPLVYVTKYGHPLFYEQFRAVDYVHDSMSRGIHAFSYHSRPFSPGGDATDGLNAIAHARVEVTIRAGDALLIPPGWFHTMASVGCPHVAVNYWWDSFSTEEIKRKRNKAMDDKIRNIEKAFVSQQQN